MGCVGSFIGSGLILTAAHCVHQRHEVDETWSDLEDPAQLMVHSFLAVLGKVMSQPEPVITILDPFFDGQVCREDGSLEGVGEARDLDLSRVDAAIPSSLIDLTCTSLCLKVA
jgi:hypothetical protein